MSKRIKPKQQFFGDELTIIFHLVAKASWWDCEMSIEIVFDKNQGKFQLIKE